MEHCFDLLECRAASCRLPQRQRKRNDSQTKEMVSVVEDCFSNIVIALWASCGRVLEFPRHLARGDRNANLESLSFVGCMELYRNAGWGLWGAKFQPLPADGPMLYACMLHPFPVCWFQHWVLYPFLGGVRSRDMGVSTLPPTLCGSSPFSVRTAECARCSAHQYRGLPVLLPNLSLLFCVALVIIGLDRCLQWCCKQITTPASPRNTRLKWGTRTNYFGTLWTGLALLRPIRIKTFGHLCMMQTGRVWSIILKRVVGRQTSFGRVIPQRIFSFFGVGCYKYTWFVL